MLTNVFPCVVLLLLLASLCVVDRLLSRDPKEYVSMKDYAPEIFRDLRERAGMTTQKYIECWDFGGPHNVPAPAEGAGRSGSLFLKSTSRDLSRCCSLFPF
jgi:hypothetical protein